MIIVKNRGNKIEISHRSLTYEINAGGRRGPAGPEGPQGPPGNPASNLVTSVNGRQGVVTGLAENSDLLAHTSDVSNPHSVTKTQVGLGNVPDIDATNRANHTGVQAISTISGLQTSLDGKQAVDSDLTDIAALSPSNDDIIQRKGGVWVNRTLLQYKADLGIASDLAGYVPYTGATSDLDLSGHDITADRIFGTPFADNYWMAPGDTEVYIGANLDDSNPGAHVYINAGNDVGGGVSGDIYLRAGSNSTDSVGSVYMLAQGVNWGARFDFSQSGGMHDIIMPSNAINLNDVSLISQKANDNEVVHLTGDENIDGIKTFSSSPIVPTPTTDMQVATKLYVDDQMAAVEGSDVDSFNGRTGAILSVEGDYTATLITNTPAGGIVATTVQAALNELDTEKVAKAGDTMIGNLSIASSTSLNINTVSTYGLQVNNSGGSGFGIGTAGSVGYIQTFTGSSLRINSLGNAVSFGPATSAALVGIGTFSPTHALTLGSATTGIVPYNTPDQTTNFERVVMSWSSNTYRIQTGNGGTGIARPIYLGSVSVGVTFDTNASNNRGVFALGTTSGTSGSSETHTLTTTAASGTMTHASFITTVNQSGTAGYTGVLVNATETSTGSGTKLLVDFQVGGSSRFSISNTGKITSVLAQTYSITNVTTDRSFDANSTTIDELADTLGTLIADLRSVGVVN